MTNGTKIALVSLAAVAGLMGCRGGAGNGPVSQADGSKPTETAPAANHPSAPPRIHFELASTGLPTEGQWKCRPAFADVNADGHVDLAAIVRLGKGAMLWLGDSQGHWKESGEGFYSESSCGGGVDFGDINHDGLLDLAVADHCHGLSIFLGDGKGGWKKVETDQGNFIRKELNKDELGVPNIGYEDVALGDVNKDGHLDLAVTGSFEGGINFFLGDGTGAKWTAKPSILPTECWANEVLLTDVTGDGLLDLVSSYCEGLRVWAGDGKGEWSARFVGLPTPSVKGLYMGVAVGDVNEDGRADVTTANWFGDVELYLQNADGSWTQTPPVFPEMIGGANGVAFADFDGDHHVDLAVSGRMTHDVGTYYGLWIFLGDGKGHFERQRDTGLPETGLEMTWNFATADVDKDGVQDFVVCTGGAQPIEPRMPKASIAEHVQVWLSRPANRSTASK